MFNLKVTTFNCHGMKTSTDTINKLCNESQIVLLQEHWLYPDELSANSQLNPNFLGLGYPLCVLTISLSFGVHMGELEFYGKGSFHKALKLLNMKIVVFLV